MKVIPKGLLADLILWSAAQTVGDDRRGTKRDIVCRNLVLRVLSQIRPVDLTAEEAGALGDLVESYQNEGDCW